MRKSTLAAVRQGLCDLCILVVVIDLERAVLYHALRMHDAVLGAGPLL